MLKFQPISQCEQISKSIGIFHSAMLMYVIRSERTYANVVEKQPVGRRLFEDYCREQDLFANWMDFLELVNQ